MQWVDVSVSMSVVEGRKEWESEAQRCRPGWAGFAFRCDGSALVNGARRKE